VTSSKLYCNKKSTNSKKKSNNSTSQIHNLSTMSTTNKEKMSTKCSNNLNCHYLHKCSKICWWDTRVIPIWTESPTCYPNRETTNSSGNPLSKP